VAQVDGLHGRIGRLHADTVGLDIEVGTDRPLSGEQKHGGHGA
jgi:hypothetical protein